MNATFPPSPNFQVGAPRRWSWLPAEPRASMVLLFSAASVAGVGLLALRGLLAGRLGHAYLVWNLFLAWVPLGWALLVRCWERTPWRAAGAGAGWLLFFPNAPYLVTDLVHLRPQSPVPLWADILLLQYFIWLALMLGFASLLEMQALLRRRLGHRASWGFVVGALALAGFGVYLGRFERWNSWDVLISPVSIWLDVWRVATQPWAHARAVAFSGLCFVVLLFAYLLVHALAGIVAALHREGASGFAASRLAARPSGALRPCATWAGGAPSGTECERDGLDLRANARTNPRRQ